MPKRSRHGNERTRRRGPVKGALIKGMSKKLPIAILDHPIFEERLKKLMKRYSGIYALYRGKRLYYVGLASDLHWRIRHHNEDKHAGKWDNFVIFRIGRVRYLKDIETLIMNLIDAPGNRVRGKVPKDADLNRILRDVLRESEKVTRGIKKALTR